MNKPPFYSRFLMTGVAFSLVGFLIVAQMVHIQTSAQAKAVTDYGKEWAYVPKTIFPERGRIYDREGQLLVGNTVKYEIGINLADVSDPETIARAMETILGMDYTKTLEKASTDQSNSAAYVLLKDFVEIRKSTGNYLVNEFIQPNG